MRKHIGRILAGCLAATLCLGLTAGKGGCSTHFANRYHPIGAGHSQRYRRPHGKIHPLPIGRGLQRLTCQKTTCVIRPVNQPGPIGWIQGGLTWDGRVIWIPSS